MHAANASSSLKEETIYVIDEDDETESVRVGYIASQLWNCPLTLIADAQEAVRDAVR